MVNIIEELKLKFKVANIPGRGRCIIISADKWQEEWDQQILEAGCDAHASGEYVYVHIEKYKPQTEKPNEETWHGQTWTKEEDALLVKLWNAKKEKNKEIANHFPNRTEASVVNRLGRLKKKGIIKPRWLTKKTKERQLPQTAEPARTPEPEHPPLEFILTQLFELLHALSCRQLMQELQLRELKGDLVIPRKLWLLYWKALDTKADRTLGPPREYKRSFQEAATEFLTGYM